MQWYSFHKNKIKLESLNADENKRFDKRATKYIPKTYAWVLNEQCTRYQNISSPRLGPPLAIGDRLGWSRFDTHSVQGRWVLCYQQMSWLCCFHSAQCRWICFCYPRRQHWWRRCRCHLLAPWRRQLLGCTLPLD